MRSASKIRTGLTAGEIKRAFRDNPGCGLGRLEGFATKHDLHVALALTVRDRLLERSVESLQTYGGADGRWVAYLSAEFLPGSRCSRHERGVSWTIFGGSKSEGLDPPRTTRTLVR
jgi:starch phosphorylase